MYLSAKQSITAQLLLSPEDVADLVTLFSQIAEEECWRPGGDIRAHVDRSVYFGLWVGGKLAGGLQIVKPDKGGTIPSQTVWPELTLPHSTRVAHIAMMAVAKAYRGCTAGDQGAAFWELAIAMWRYCVESGIQQLWLEATPRTLRCYQRLGWPLTVQGPLRTHWGEECYPCSMSVREVAGSLTERALRSKQYHRLLTQAIRHDAACASSAEHP